MRRLLARHETASFLALTFGLSWPLWIASGVLGRGPAPPPDRAWLVAQLGVFAPSLAGLILAALLEKGAWRRAVRIVALVYAPATALGAAIATRGFPSWLSIDGSWLCGIGALGVCALLVLARAGNRVVPWPGPPARAWTVALWTAGCVVVPAALMLAAWALTPGEGALADAVATGGARPLTATAVLAALAVNLSFGGSLGEELGWRGFWLPRLLRAHGPLLASLILGFWWALWHAPIDLAAGFGPSGIGALLLRQIWVLPLAFLFTWASVRSGGNLLVPLALHTTINAFPDFGLVDPGRYQRAMMMLWGFLLILAVLAALLDRSLRPVPDGRPDERDHRAAGTGAP